MKKIQQNIEGTVDEVKGRLEQQRGETIKGGFHVAKGKLKKATAPLHDRRADTKDVNTEDDIV